MDSNPDSDHLSHVDCDPDSNPDSGPGARVNTTFDTMRWRYEYCIILRERRKIEIGELEGLRERKLKELYEVAHAILQ